MGCVLSIAQKELRSYFNSPIAYIVIGLFLLVIGYLYFSTLYLVGFASLRHFFDLASLIMVVLAPALTMRLVAEERKTGTIEYLRTFPVTEVQVALGKFLASLMITGVGLALTIPYAFCVAMLTPDAVGLDAGPVVGGYLGLLLLSSVFLSVGLLASALTRNQIVAFIIGLALCFVLFVIDKVAFLLPASLSEVFEYLSVDYHFAQMARGVVDSRDILFYLSLTLLALMMSVLALKPSTPKTAYPLVGFTMVALIFANLIGVTNFFHVDLTKDNKYTLSQGSQDTMQSLKDTMVISAYFTQGLPSPYASFTRYVRDMLEEYRVLSHGKLAFEFVDPGKGANGEDKQEELSKLGMTPVWVRVIEDDQQQTKRAYMGLVVRYQGKTEVMPVVQDFANFEKDLTTLMRKLVRERMPKLAIVSDLAGASLSNFKQLVSQTARVEEITGDEISKHGDLDALLVVGTGRSLSNKNINAIEAFIASGKSVAFLVDQQEFDPGTLKALPSREKRSEALTALLAQHGVAIEDKLVADQSNMELMVQEQREGMVFAVPVRYPLFPLVGSLDQESPVTRGLSGAVFPFVSPISVAKGKGRFLAQSSEKSWLESEPFNTDLHREWPQQGTSSGRYGLLVALDGPSRVLVAGTSAFLWNDYLSEANLALALASVDYLLADDVMLSMHSRNFADLTIDPSVSEMKRALIKYGNIFGIPAALAIYGILRWQRRERRRRTLTLDSIH